jgi:hypothetical protein
MPRPLGDGKLIASLVLGVVTGVVIGHVFKKHINAIWAKTPYLKKYPGND